MTTKRLLLYFGLLRLMQPALAQADSVTSGQVGLLIPSTGVIDTQRRLDDKYNKNFQIVASTLNTVITSVSGSTGALGDSFHAYAATADARMNSLVINSFGVIFPSMTANLVENSIGVIATTQAMTSMSGGTGHIFIVSTNALQSGTTVFISSAQVASGFMVNEATATKALKTETLIAQRFQLSNGGMASQGGAIDISGGAALTMGGGGSFTMNGGGDIRVNDNGNLILSGNGDFTIGSGDILATGGGDVTIQGGGNLNLGANGASASQIVTGGGNISTDGPITLRSRLSHINNLGGSHYVSTGAITASSATFNTPVGGILQNGSTTEVKIEGGTVTTFGLIASTVLVKGLPILDGTSSTHTKIGGVILNGALALGGVNAEGQKLALPTGGFAIGVSQNNDIRNTDGSLTISAGDASRQGGCVDCVPGNIVLRTGRRETSSPASQITVQVGLNAGDANPDTVGYTTVAYVNASGMTIGPGAVAPSYELDVYGVARTTGAAYFATVSGSVTIGSPNGLVPTASSRLDVTAGSITVRGLNSGLSVGVGTAQVTITGGTGTFRGVVLSTVQAYGITYKMPKTAPTNGMMLSSDGDYQLYWGGGSNPIIAQDEGSDLSTATVINFEGAGVSATNSGSTITVTIAGGGGGGGNNQQVNTATVTFCPSEFQGGGPVFIATAPRIPIPGKVWTDPRSTFNVISIQSYTGVVSTATDANISFRLAESTPTGVDYHIISSTAEITSSSNTDSPVIRYSTEISTSFSMFPRHEYMVLIPSAPSGGAPPAENWKLFLRGWWSP